MSGDFHWVCHPLESGNSRDCAPFLLLLFVVLVVVVVSIPLLTMIDCVCFSLKMCQSSLRMYIRNDMDTMQCEGAMRCEGEVR